MLDLGAARSSISGQEAGMTVMFTLGYAPFEQYTLTQTLGPWTDIYPVGATLLHTLTGRAPLAAIDRNAAKDAGSTDVVQLSLDTLEEHVSLVFRQAAGWMMQSEAGRRPQSMEDVLALIDPQDATSTQRAFTLRTAAVGTYINRAEDIPTV